uniref:Neuronal pentraxin 1 n=1 Tax=Crocodylus porosus TaxID=8502 RepID=A0A7M4FMB1_CROPO
MAVLGAPTRLPRLAPCCLLRGVGPAPPGSGGLAPPRAASCLPGALWGGRGGRAASPRPVCPTAVGGEASGVPAAASVTPPPPWLPAQGLPLGGGWAAPGQVPGGAFGAARCGEPPPPEWREQGRALLSVRVRVRVRACMCGGGAEELRSTVLQLRESVLQQKETILNQKETIRELTAKLGRCESQSLLDALPNEAKAGGRKPGGLPKNTMGDLSRAPAPPDALQSKIEDLEKQVLSRVNSLEEGKLSARNDSEERGKIESTLTSLHQRISDLEKGSGLPRAPSPSPLTFPLRTNYMYAKVKKSLPEMYAFTVCMWLKSNAAPGVGTPFSYAVHGQANELVLIEWGNNPMEILINDKVGAAPPSLEGLCCAWTWGCRTEMETAEAAAQAQRSCGSARQDGGALAQPLGDSHLTPLVVPSSPPVARLASRCTALALAGEQLPWNKADCSSRLQGPSNNTSARPGAAKPGGMRLGKRELPALPGIACPS